MLKILLAYLLLLNLISIFFMASDKRKAKKGRWRIAEKTLFLLAFLGGSIGIYLGMYLFHHKTRKPLFRFGIPAIILLQILAAVFILCWQNNLLFY